MISVKRLPMISKAENLERKSRYMHIVMLMLARMLSAGGVSMLYCMTKDAS